MLYILNIGECHLPLGFEHGKIKDDQISASSYLSDSFKPYFARLRNASYWSPCPNDTAPWIQVSFQRPVIISILVIQGAGMSGSYVKEAMVSYSSDGNDWRRFEDVNENTEVSGICVTFRNYIKYNTSRLLKPFKRRQ